MTSPAISAPRLGSREFPRLLERRMYSSFNIFREPALNETRCRISVALASLQQIAAVNTSLVVPASLRPVRVRA